MTFEHCRKQNLPSLLCLLLDKKTSRLRVKNADLPPPRGKNVPLFSPLEIVAGRSVITVLTRNDKQVLCAVYPSLRHCHCQL